jgi:hypothetical protein
MALDEALCPRCGTLVGEYDRRRFAEALAAGERIQEERRLSETRVDALEARHRLNAWQGLLFWIAAAVILVVLVVLAASVMGTLVGGR